MMDTDPIDLYQCFKAFVRDDELGEEESWLVYHHISPYTTVYHSMTVYPSIPQYIAVHSICLAGTVKSARNTRKQSRVWRYGVSLLFW